MGLWRKVKGGRIVFKGGVVILYATLKRIVHIRKRKCEELFMERAHSCK